MRKELILCVLLIALGSNHHIAFGEVSPLGKSSIGHWPSFYQALVGANVSFIAGFGDSVGVRLRNSLQSIIGGRLWTNGIDAGHIM